MRRFIRTGLLASIVLAGTATLTTVPAGATARARAARTISGADSAHLHLLPPGRIAAVRGRQGDRRAARPHARATHVAQQYSGTCTIYTNGGSVTGHGVATPHGTGRFQSFKGTLTITGGSRPLPRRPRTHGPLWNLRSQDVLARHSDDRKLLLLSATS